MTSLRALAGGNAIVLRALVAVRNDAGESQSAFARRLGSSRESVELAEAGRLPRLLLLQHVERVLARCTHGLARVTHGELQSFVHHEAVRQAHARIANALLDAEHAEQDRKDEEQW